MGIYEDYLMHFNPNHDPETGQFTSKSGGAMTNPQRKVIRQMNRAGAATKNVSEWIEKKIDIPESMGKSRGIKRKMASVMFETVMKHYDKLDKYVAKLNATGDSMTGDGWKQFNKDREAIGKRFMERTKGERAAILMSSLVVPPAAAPFIVGSSKYKMR